jgi:aromatic-L-amino-acid decarboxylase
MDPEEFRRLAHDLVDWMADYQAGVGELPVFPGVTPGEIRSQLPTSAPEVGEDFGEILRDFREILMPGVTHWNHPSFFAYFPANNSGPAILGEMLSAALGINGMLWETCPSATELEEVVLDWLRQLIGLPEGFRGVIQDTASTSTLVALIQARERASEGGVNRRGFTENQDLVVYTSREAHSSILKGARVAGFGSERVRAVAVDENLGMIPGDLRRLVAEDRAAGRTPCALVATIGTTSSTAVDPLLELAEVAEEECLFLHVDAALAGSAAILPEKRHLFLGMERADSFVFNPHKWLFTNFDCSVQFVRDPDELQRCFAINPEYLKTSVDGQVTNYRDWGVALGRRFRALKLWFVLRYHGVEGLRSQLREHLRLAQDFSRWVDETPGLERLAPVPLITICFRFHPHGILDEEDDLELENRKILERIKAGRKAYFTHTKLGDRFCLRVAIGQTLTESHHVEGLKEQILEAMAQGRNN